MNKEEKNRVTQKALYDAIDYRLWYLETIAECKDDNSALEREKYIILIKQWRELIRKS